MQWSLRPQSSRKKQISIRNGCTGSPACATEIHIERIDTLAWQEIHLTRRETIDIIAALVEALTDPESE